MLFVDSQDIFYPFPLKEQNGTGIQKKGEAPMALESLRATEGSEAISLFFEAGDCFARPGPAVAGSQ